MSDATASKLSSNIASAFNLPAHLKEAFHPWIQSVEERLGGLVSGEEGATEDLKTVVMRLVEEAVAEAVEKYIADHDDQLKGSPVLSATVEVVEDVVRRVLAERDAKSGSSTTQAQEPNPPNPPPQQEAAEKDPPPPEQKSEKAPKPKAE